VLASYVLRRLQRTSLEGDRLHLGLQRRGGVTKKGDGAGMEKGMAGHVSWGRTSVPMDDKTQGITRQTKSVHLSEGCFDTGGVVEGAEGETGTHGRGKSSEYSCRVEIKWGGGGGVGLGGKERSVCWGRSV